MSPAALAKRAGVSTDTLRYYERCGLLTPARTPTGYRVYSDADAARVQLVRRALAIGFSLKELARVLAERDRGGAPCRKVHALVRSRLANIDSEIAALVALKADLSTLLEDWNARLRTTPAGRQARLLDHAQPVSGAAQRRGARGLT